MPYKILIATGVPDHDRLIQETLRASRHPACTPVIAGAGVPLAIQAAASGCGALVLGAHYALRRARMTLRGAMCAMLPMVIVADTADCADAAPDTCDPCVALSTTLCSCPLLAQVIHDLIERHRLSLALEDRERSTTAVLDAIGDGVLVADREGVIRYLNDAAARLLRCAPDHALGRTAVELLPLVDGPAGAPLQPHPVTAALASGNPSRVPPGTFLLRTGARALAIADSTSPIPGAAGAVQGVVVVFHDVSSEYAASEKLAYEAHHDPLTGLPNRSLLLDRVNQAIALAQRNQTQFALLFLDLDHFKHVNDSLGHAIGDDLLCAVARRLEQCVRNSDTVSRLGGDEFAILLADDIGGDAAERICHKIQTELAAPLALGQHVLRIRCSIGVSRFPANGNDAMQLLHHADQAMYCAKRRTACLGEAAQVDAPPREPLGSGTDDPAQTAAGAA